MDPKSRADFIKSMAEKETGDVKTLPKDNSEDKSKAAFEPVKAETVEAEELESAFAEGLPEWSILPPQIVVRRKRK